MAARRRQVRVLVFDTLPGLAIGVAVSGVSFVYRASHPDIAELSKVRATAELFAERERHPVNEPVDGITILRVEGGLFVANADVVRRACRGDASQPGLTAIVVDARTVGAIDGTAMRVLVELCEELAAHGTRSVIADAISQMRDLIRSEQAVEHHTLTVFPTVSRAFEALQT